MQFLATLLALLLALALVCAAPTAKAFRRVAVGDNVAQIEADLVLDFLGHPDLSMDLGHLCTTLGIPVVASGKKSRDGLVITPPT